MSLFDLFGALMSDVMYQTAGSRQREGVVVKVVRYGQVLVFDWSETSAMEVYLEPGAYFVATLHPVQGTCGVEYPEESLAVLAAKERGFHLFAKPGVYVGGLGPNRLLRAFEEPNAELFRVPPLWREVLLASLPDAPPGFVVTGFEPYDLDEVSGLRVAVSYGEVAFVRDNHVVIHNRTYNAGAQVFRTMFVGKHQAGIKRGQSVEPGTILGTYPGGSLLEYENDYVTYVTAGINLPERPEVGCIDIAYDKDGVVGENGILGASGGVLVRRVDDLPLHASPRWIHLDGSLVTFMAAGVLVDDGTVDLSDDSGSLSYYARGLRYVAYDDDSKDFQYLLGHPAVQAAASEYRSAVAECERAGEGTEQAPEPEDERARLRRARATAEYQAKAAPPPAPLTARVASKTAAWLRALASRIES